MGSNCHVSDVKHGTLFCDVIITCGDLVKVCAFAPLLSKVCLLVDYLSFRITFSLAFGDINERK